MEIWKDIKGYEGLYQVSTFGRVKCLPKDVVSTKYGHKRHYPERIAKTFTRNGYPSVELSKNGKAKKFTVHRLVASAFINNPENKPQVNHIDGNKLNNYVENLEWVTASENIRHAYDKRLKISPSGKKHWTIRRPEKVHSRIDEVTFLKVHKMLQKGFTRKEVAEKLKLPKNTLARIARNEIKKFEHLI